MVTPGARQIAGKPFGGGYSVGCGMPSADDANADGGQKLGAPPYKKDRGRVEDPAQRFRVADVAEGDQLCAGLADLLLLGCRIVETAAAGDRSRDCASQAGGFELGR